MRLLRYAVELPSPIKAARILRDEIRAIAEDGWDHVTKESGMHAKILGLFCEIFNFNILVFYQNTETLKTADSTRFKVEPISKDEMFSHVSLSQYTNHAMPMLIFYVDR